MPGEQKRELNKQEIKCLEKILEALETIDFPSQDQRKQMEDLAFALFIAYRDGGDDWAPDEDRADFYLAKILIIAPPENITEHSLFWLSWITTLRLNTWRFDCEYELSFPKNKSLLPDNFNALQLSFLPELLVCFYKLFSKSFRPKIGEDKDKWFYQRFERKRLSQVFWDMKFLGVLSNAFVWCLMNFICYFCFPQGAVISCCLTIAGLLFDIAHDWILANREWKEYKDLEKENIVENYGVKEIISAKVEELNFKRKYAAVVAVGIFLGMTLLYFPILIPAIPAWYGVSITMVLGNLDKIKYVGSTILVISSVGLSCCYGRLRELATQKTREQIQDFLKNNSMETGFTAFLVIPAFYFASLFPASIVASAFTLGIPAVMVLTFAVVKAISYLWNKKSPLLYPDTIPEPPALNLEENPKNLSTTQQIIEYLKSLSGEQRSMIQCRSGLSFREIVSETPKNAKAFVEKLIASNEGSFREDRVEEYQGRESPRSRPGNSRG